MPDSPEDVVLIAFVRGRTQGVGFRAFVVDRAGKLGLRGFVRNLPGGRTVEVVAQGPQDNLDLLLSALRQGPPMAHVERVDVSWGEATGVYEGFSVR